MRTLNVKSVLILFYLFNAFSDATEEVCPIKCKCKRTSQRDGANYLKMVCGEFEQKILHLDELELLDIGSELVQLNLSGNNLRSFSPKVELIALQKLDLSRNQIKELQNNQFHEAPNLRRLDLSENQIESIDLHSFKGLKHLERLKLSQNHITTIMLGTFDGLLNFKQLDISANPLQCDCGLLWLLDWTQKFPVKLISNPKCNSPPTFRSLPLRKLKIGIDIHCKSPANSEGLPILDLKPNENQVVFEGDNLRLSCKAPSISDVYDDNVTSSLGWTYLDSNPKLYFSDLVIENQFLPSTGLISSTLSISKLKKNHTGIWNCVFVSIQGENHSKGITVVVISNETEYCPITTTKNNKGVYNWPRTIVNYNVTVPCESLNMNYDVTEQTASYFCGKDGEWKDLDTSRCSYISDTTKILEQFSKVNSSILESARHFKNYTSNLRIFKDVMDLVFAVETIENYLKFSLVEHVSSILMDVSSKIMELPKWYLYQGETEHRSCQKLVNCTESLALQTPSTLLQKENIALEVFPVKKDGFTGLKCSWYINPNNRLDSIFSCVTNNQQDLTSLQGKITEASVTIPDTLFYQLQEEQDLVLPNIAYNVLVSVHSKSKLFPIDEKRQGKEDVTSAVIGTKLVEMPVRNLSSPVYIMLRMPQITTFEVTPFTPVWWDPDLENGTWTSQGCRFNHELPDHVVFSCRDLGYYGLLQDVSHLATNQVAKFKLSHPAIYVGSSILFISFLIAILTYLLCYATIQMPKKAKHSLINTWISISLLCFMYCFGIYQTEDVRMCQIIGMVLHYLTLCSLLWICVSVNCMYKRLSKNDAVGLQDDDLPSEQPIRKPILGLYLVGWGVALIICGLSAAINIKEYSSVEYCFLRTGPALSALYIPFTILLLFLCVFFLLVRCAIYNIDSNGHLSEGTQATEHVDLDLLEPNFPNLETRSIRSISSKTPSSEIEDSEHAPSAQLKAAVIFLALYIMTWLSCAFATVPPFRMVTYEAELFSVAYVILATTLSSFTLFFYCVARNDVRSQWGAMCRTVRKRKRGVFRTRNVTDTAANVPQSLAQHQPSVLVANSVVVTESQVLHSRSSSRSSTRTKSNSHTSNILIKGAVDLNGSFVSTENNRQSGTKINNVNLIALHRAQYRTNMIPNIIENPTNAAEVFYNPHQSTVARKFFKKQKRDMLKKNNSIVKPPRDVNSDTASVFSEPKLVKNKMNVSQNMFGTNSKVNNTNIHVELVNNCRKQRDRNPNIFSDSGDDFDNSALSVPVEKIVINAERLRNREQKSRKKQQNNSLVERHDNNMRSVSQQCTLDYSSENISDSIFEKCSPDKSLLPLNPDSMSSENAVVPSIRRENSPMCSILTEEDPNYAKIRDNKTLMPKSRASSISVSDLDEIYQQIRHGPALQPKKLHIYSTIAHSSPCLSDSEVTSYVSDLRNRHRMSLSIDNFDNISDDIETTV